METLIHKIEKAIQDVINGFCSQYIKYDSDNGDTWTIRVSNHAANPARVFELENYISLVVNVPDKEIDDCDCCSSLGINKKNFTSIANQYFLNKNGDFTEQFYDVEEMLEFHLN